MNGNTGGVLSVVKLPETGGKTAIVGHATLVEIDGSQTRHGKCGSFENARAENYAKIHVFFFQDLGGPRRIQIFHAKHRSPISLADLVQTGVPVGKRISEKPIHGVVVDHAPG